MEMEQRYAALAEYLPPEVRPALADLFARRGGEVEELRFRVGCPVGVVLCGREISLCGPDGPIRADAPMLADLLRRAAHHSRYAVQNQLRRGFVTLPGGHRLGVCGTAVFAGGSLENLTDLQSMALRIARDCPGAAEAATNLLWSHPASALIAGRPGSGKTTVLRDLIRQVSDRFGQRVAVVDERGELAACLDGSPQLRVGRLTDVLSFCGKAEGIELLLRSMRPDWIALDEISAEEDLRTILRASYCGARFLATVHVLGPEDLRRRPLYRRLMEAGVFENLIYLEKDRSLRCERVDDAVS